MTCCCSSKNNCVCKFKSISSTHVSVLVTQLNNQLFTGSASASFSGTGNEPEPLIEETNKQSYELALQYAETIFSPYKNLVVINSKTENELIEINCHKNKSPGYMICNVDELPVEIINPELNLSFKDIGIKLDNFLIQLITILTPTPLFEELINNTTEDPELLQQFISVLRRLFSNYVNNPNNITDVNGKYIGDKYGIRLLYCSNDGNVYVDTQTFCKNVAVKPYVGINNNYIIEYVNPNSLQSLAIPGTIISNPSNISLSNYTSNGYSIKFNTLKCYSPELPKSPDQENLIYNVFGPAPEYNVIPETPPQTSTFFEFQNLDNFGAYKEIQQAQSCKYGFASRRSTSNIDAIFSWMVSRNLANDLFVNPGTNFIIRISFFKFI